MAPTVRFFVTRGDVQLLLDELPDHLPRGLYAPLLKQLPGAAAVLDGGTVNRTDLQFGEPEAQVLREWLWRSEIRESSGGSQPKARAFARIRNSER